MNTSAKTFGLALWAGILLEWSLGLPTIFNPNIVAETLGLRLPSDPVWASFAALLVVLVSLFFIPAARDPYRYGAISWLAVIVNLPVAFFFLWLWRGEYPLFGYLALALFVVQLPLLIKAMREAPYL